MKPAHDQYYPDDIAQALCKIVDVTSEAEINDCTEALYQLKAIAQNKYNSDYYRTLYAVLSKLMEV